MKESHAQKEGSPSQKKEKREKTKKQKKRRISFVSPLAIKYPQWNFDSFCISNFYCSPINVFNERLLSDASQGLSFCPVILYVRQSGSGFKEANYFRRFIARLASSDKEQGFG